MHPDEAVEDLPTENIPSIISAATKTAIKNAVKVKMAKSLWQTKNFLHLGTPGKYVIITYSNNNGSLHPYLQELT